MSDIDESPFDDWADVDDGTAPALADDAFDDDWGIDDENQGVKSVPESNSAGDTAPAGSTPCAREESSVDAHWDRLVPTQVAAAASTDPVQKAQTKEEQTDKAPPAPPASKEEPPKPKPTALPSPPAAAPPAKPATQPAAPAAAPPSAQAPAKGSAPAPKPDAPSKPSPAPPASLATAAAPKSEPEPSTASAEQPVRSSAPPVKPQSQSQSEIQPDEPEATEAAASAPGASSAAGKGAWGWGSLASLGGTLKAVAAGAVRDVQGLAVSAQQALAEVEYEESEDDNSANTNDDTTTEADTRTPNPPPPTTKQDAPQAAGPAQRKKTVAQARQGEGSGSQGEVHKESGDAGLAPVTQEASRSTDKGQEVGKSMEQLATGAAKAFTSLWTGISGVARNTATLVSKVEAVTYEVAKDLVSGAGVRQDVAQLQAVAASGVRGVAANVGKLGTRIEAGLETVGRTAFHLLEEVAGVPPEPTHLPKGSGHDTGGHEGTQQGPNAYRTFDELLDLYGGRQLLEDQENLANECARIANRARAKLEAVQQAELDSATASLGPTFSRPLHPATAAKPTDAHDLTALEQMEQRYAPVRFLCQDSTTRAQAFQELLRAAAAQDAELARQPTTTPTTAPTAAAEPSTGAPGTDTEPASSEQPQDASTATEPAASGKAEAEKSETGAAKSETGGDKTDVVASVGSELDGWDTQMPAAAAADGSAAGAADAAAADELLPAALAQVRAHAFKRLAELLTAQLQLLSDYGVGLSAPARTVDVQAASVIDWPVAAASQAALLRYQAERMWADTENVGTQYVHAVAAVVAPTHTEEGTTASDQPHVALAQSVRELGTEVLQQLQAACTSSGAKLEEAFRSLLFTVLVRDLVERVAGGDAQ